MNMAGAKNHDYHIIDPSPWPAIASVSAFILAIGGVLYMHGTAEWKALYLLPGMLGVIFTMFGWWADIIKESHDGHHTRVVSMHLRYGMILFIASEVMFFVAWFWAFFDAALFYDVAEQFLRVEHTGGHWPPESIYVIDPLHLPLYNTLILLTSGTTVTWAHHSLLHNDREGLIVGLCLTIALGIVFSCVQAYEYIVAPFDFTGSIYGATFVMATGFHGFHVFVGTIFLIVCLVRALRGDFTPEKHFGFEAAAWYWHFVDVVWLFLFVFVYVWASVGAHIAH